MKSPENRSRSLEDQNKLSKRRVLMGAAAAAGLGLGLVGLTGGEKVREVASITKEEPKKVPPKVEKVRLKLAEESEKSVEKIVSELPESPMEKVLVFDTKNRALANNYREFVVLNAFGEKYSKYESNRQILAERNALIEDPKFKVEFLDTLSKTKARPESRDSFESLIDSFVRHPGFDVERRKAVKGMFGDDYPNSIRQGYLKLSYANKLLLAERIQILIKYNHNATSDGVFSGYVRVLLKS